MVISAYLSTVFEEMAQQLGRELSDPYQPWKWIEDVKSRPIFSSCPLLFDHQERPILGLAETLQRLFAFAWRIEEIQVPLAQQLVKVAMRLVWFVCFQGLSRCGRGHED